MNQSIAFLALVFLWLSSLVIGKAPNIVFIISDDQDRRLGSLNYMPNVQRGIVAEGVNIVNHFGTVALCCPARATLLRGQAAHNTNVTHVGGPAGAWPKFLATGENNDNLAHWLKSAGYTTAYLGKFMNGYGMRNYDNPPAGWDWLDLLVQPHIYEFNHVVMSQNGETPVYYEGWHQTDVLRLKALEQLNWMTRQEKPFYLEVAPASPHVRIGGWPTVPLKRYKHYFPGAMAPRTPNWNPLDDELHQAKPAWVGKLPVMNETVVEIIDRAFQKRLQGLQGVDEIVEDVVELLEEAGVLEDTFIIYTTDNGFHIGNHRLTEGKGLPYIEDTNLPLAVRGPGIPRGAQLSIPSSHIDMAPTILDIAGVPSEQWPEFFDGRSLLPEWKNLVPEDEHAVSREVINVEYWGSTVTPAEPFTKRWHDNTYKSVRLVGEKQGWLFNRWCTGNQTELYNTTADPYELHNLAIEPSTEVQRVIDRLSGLLLVTKSCGRDTCRKPWEVLRAACEEAATSEDVATFANADQIPLATSKYATFSTLDEAMDTKYDKFFASLPHSGFQSCLPYQKTENEAPFFPTESEELGRRYRGEEDGSADAVIEMATLAATFESGDEFGDESQRHASIEDLMRSARPLKESEIGPTVQCTAPDYCVELYED